MQFRFRYYRTPGFATVFVAMGAGASSLSHILLRYRYEAGIVGGVVVTLFGLMTAGFLRLIPKLSACDSRGLPGAVLI